MSQSSEPQQVTLQSKLTAERVTLNHPKATTEGWWGHPVGENGMTDREPKFYAAVAYSIVTAVAQGPHTQVGGTNLSADVAVGGGFMSDQGVTPEPDEHYQRYSALRTAYEQAIEHEYDPQRKELLEGMLEDLNEENK